MIKDPLPAYITLHSRRALDGLELVGGDLPVEVVHDTRTSLRRLRATLRTFPDSFAGPAALDEDLQWVSIALGEVRDADVLRELLAAQRDHLPADSFSTCESLDRALTARRRSAVEDLGAPAHTERWGRSVAQLNAWDQHRPVLRSTDHPTTLERLWRLTRDRLADSAGDPVALHSARKAAKRWRYAAELLAPVESSAAAHLARAEEFQEVLGAVQDAVILADFLDQHCVDGGSSATLQLLQARNRRRYEEQVGRALSLL